MRRPIHFLLVLVVTASGCASSPSAPTEPTVLTLAPGASENSGNLVVKFVRVTGDSRCPGDALCITAGDAQAAIETTLLGLKESAELHLFDPAKRMITRGNYVITFDALSPYPFLSQGPIAPSAYRATFKITRQ